MTSNDRVANFMDGHHAMARILADVLPSVETALFEYAENTAQAGRASLAVCKEGLRMEGVHEERHKSARQMKAEFNKANYAVELQKLMDAKEECIQAFAARD